MMRKSKHERISTPGILLTSSSPEQPETLKRELPNYAPDWQLPDYYAQQLAS
jgi:hypothetical protein